MDNNNHQELVKRLGFMDMDEQTRHRLQKLRPIIAREIGKGLDRFYAKLRNTPEVARFFNSDGHMAAAKSAQTGHWDSISSGAYDQQYLSKVTTIGGVHARIGLEPRWYIGGYALILESLIVEVAKTLQPRKGLFGIFGRKGATAEELGKTLGALVKAALLDMDLAISVYLAAAEEAKRRARRKSLPRNAQRCPN